MTRLFPRLPDDTRRIIDSLPGLIDKVFPLPARFRFGLKKDVAYLSRLLTMERSERGISYLGRPALLSAYLRYFLPWNVYRLCRLFSSLPLDLKPHDAVNDLGSGPLTLAVSLWISRPDLRKIPLEFRCLDRTAAVLEAGKKLFAALAAGTGVEAGNCPWEIRTIRGELRRTGSLSAEIRGKSAALTTAVNLYNELFWDFSPVDWEGLETFAGRQARLLSALTEKSGAILVVEPGIPRSGEFISLLRSFLMEEGRFPASPCVHPGTCPLPGRNISPRKTGKPKWCHFAFDTDDAPPALHKLSGEAGLPKERAVLSFILSGPVCGKPQPLPEKNASRGKVKLRVISDMFPVGNLGPDGPRRGSPIGKKGSWGRYGCGESGLVLVSGDSESLAQAPSGALEELPLSGQKDEKSGALVAEKK